MYYLIYYKVSQLFCLLVSIATVAYTFQHGDRKSRREFKFVMYVSVTTNA